MPYTDVASHHLLFLLGSETNTKCVCDAFLLKALYADNKQYRYVQSDRKSASQGGGEETETKSVTTALLAVRHWRRMKWSKTNDCGKPVFIVRAELVLLRHEGRGRR